MRATIYVKKDPSCEMAKVYTRIGTLPKGMKTYDFGMEGNYWDFHPGCHGMHQFGDFNSPSGLAHAIMHFLLEHDYTVRVVHGTYKWR